MNIISFFIVVGKYVAGTDGAVKNCMYLFDELIVWKTRRHTLDGIEVHIYHCDNEISKEDVNYFSYEHYTLHDKNGYMVEIQIGKNK